MEAKNLRPPDGWGDDALSKFGDLFIRNEWSSFVHSSDWQTGLSSVMSVLTACNKALLPSNPLDPDLIASLLLMSATTHWIGSARTALSGHCLPTYATGRAATETAIYGWYIKQHPGAQARWMNKPAADDKAGRRAWSNEFSFSTIARKLGASEKATCEWALYIHQTAIDFGAHPNIDALLSNVAGHEDEEGFLNLEGLVVAHDGGNLFYSTLKFTFEVGVFIVAMIFISFPELLGPGVLAQCLSRLRATLVKLQASTLLDPA